MLAAVGNLEAAGFRGAEIERRRLLFELARRGLPPGTGGPILAWHVPGRIEVLGKHTDYAGGRSLLCATESGFAVTAVPRPDPIVRVVDSSAGAAREVPLGAGAAGSPGDWSNYLATVARRLARDFGAGLRGADVSLASDLPIAAGVSSSSALVIAIGLAVIEVNGLEQRPRFAGHLRTLEDLAAYFGAIENGRPFGPFESAAGVGTLGGNQDQTAILCSRPDALVQYRFDPVAHQRTVRFPESHVFVVAASGVAAEKAGAALERYNGLARETALLATLAGRALPTRAGTLVDRLIAEPAAAGPVLEAIEREVGDPARRDRLRHRLLQLVEECGALIPALADAIEQGDLSAIGDLAARSQRGAEVGLENQIPETRGLVSIAGELGAAGASAFGAGFGGSVWAMVPASEAGRFASEWRRMYLDKFPGHRSAARFFPTRPGPPAVRIVNPLAAR